MPENNSQSPLDDRYMVLAVGPAWYLIFDEEPAIQETQPQDYVQQSAQPEASGQVQTFSTSEQAALTRANRSRRRAIHPSLDAFGAFRQFAVAMSAIYRGDFDQLVEEEGSGIQFSASQVEDFVQTLARVEASALGVDDLTCSICKLEYGKGRGNITEPACDAEQGLLGEEMPEYPVKLSCGHVFGDWCIKTWLVEQPASCPTCRFHFQPV